jgi:hypothetical protein
MGGGFHVATSRRRYEPLNNLLMSQADSKGLLADLLFQELNISPPLDGTMGLGKRLAMAAMCAYSVRMGFASLAPPTGIAQRRSELLQKEIVGLGQCDTLRSPGITRKQVQQRVIFDREKNDGNRAGNGGGFQSPAGFNSGDALRGHIQQDNIGPTSIRLGNNFAIRGSPIEAKTLMLEKVGVANNFRFCVVDDKDVCHVFHSRVKKYSLFP